MLMIRHSVYLLGESGHQAKHEKEYKEYRGPDEAKQGVPQQVGQQNAFDASSGHAGRVHTLSHFASRLKGKR